MKRAEYVAAVTSVYRKALDTGHVTRPMMDDLMDSLKMETNVYPAPFDGTSSIRLALL